MRLSLLALSVSVVLVAAPVHAQYKLPPAPLQALVDAPRAPSLHLSPQRDAAFLVQTPELPSIADVAAPELKLAGARINPRTAAASRFSFGSNLSLLDLASQKTAPVSGLPQPLRLADSAWSPTQRHIAFTHVGADGVQLWVVDVAKRSAHKLMSAPLAAVFNRGFEWLPDGSGLIVTLRTAQADKAPRTSGVPDGPVMQETSGGAVRQLRTYPDMLRNEDDARVFSFYATAQLASVNLSGAIKPLGAPAMVSSFAVAPNGQLVLTQTLARPFSYLVPYSSFPHKVEVRDMSGKLVQLLAERPLLEGLPSGSVAAGKRDFSWRADAPATLVWTESEGGKNATRDRVYMQAAPFEGKPVVLANLGSRYAGMRWGRGDFAIVSEYAQKTKQTRMWRIRPDQPETAPEELFSFNNEDRYHHPGTPVSMPDKAGRMRLVFGAGDSLLLIGAGASDEGDRPFVDRYDPATKKAERLFQSSAPVFENVVALLSDDGKRLLTTRESPTEAPNYFVRQGDQVTALTHNPHPTPQLKDVKKELIRYKRADGVALSATLMLPPNYAPDKDGPLPMLMWAYPREFNSEEAASQTTGSPYKFNAISYWGPAAFLAMGYAVLDNPAMPIVGAKGKEPNDTYLPQLIMDAQAAVDEVVKRGVADPKRIAIGGHSYGAFMTANLLAHTRLFKAGIARSGAYNRTLTPFGFQSEERNYWKAKDVYNAMAPFNYADQIKDALLMIHGADDNNPGTFPIQSERMFAAVKGLGGTARLVMLPNEAHAYRARESILHMLAETNDWLEKYVKNAK
ncbi:prolyl oligopeptidase family serine peptidase [Massilia sp. TS11]|uniref:S9 family peptidase n=1 Tax=Massilia sp. TS11 TaxID=2908003 RepID=UPI001ED9E4DD|nr:prolyl oligopeptidase family serine peptidase [Massilia sp. TS11]MCG2585034.1 prolyl oligopeptidase family serine peptidase [Massilia sp. TS11]